MERALSIRIPEEMYCWLAAREERTDVPTSNYVRRLIRTAMSQNIVDAEPEPAQLPAPLSDKIAELKQASIAESKPVPVPESKPAQNIHTRLARQSAPNQILTSPTKPRFEDGE